MRFSQRNLVVILFVSFSLALPGVRGMAATPDACALVPQAKVAKIIGNDAPIFTQQPTTERSGAKMSSCVYQQARGGGNSAHITVATFDSAAAAQERLKQYGEAMVKSGGFEEPDSVSGLTAIFITSKGGQGQLSVVKGNVLLGVSVSGVEAGKVTPRRELARLLMLAALAGI